MTDVLIIGDTERMVDLRHVVPVQITDAFVYAEVGGQQLIGISNFEIERIREAGVTAEFRPMEHYKPEEVARQTSDVYVFRNEMYLRAVRDFGIERAVIPRCFPAGVADHLRANGIELEVDQRLFDDRRRVKNDRELAGIRRAQRAAEAGMAAARELLRRAVPSNGGYTVDGEELTCELVKRDVERAFAAHNCTADDFIVSHGAQTAVGHDMGHGAIATDDVVLLDLFPRDRESSCFADMTRTFVVGSAPDELREYHRLAREALDLAVAEIRPGVEGKELHRKVSDFFAGHGYPTNLTKPEGSVLEDGFYHATGHGVGLAVHEQPAIGRIGEPFVPGDVLAIEPGLYRNGFGGARLEDLVLVTEAGCEVITDFPYDLDVRD